MNVQDVSGGTTDHPARTTVRRITGRDVIRLGSLDVRGTNARIELVDDDPVMFVDDGDREIEFSSGIGGSWDQAITGAERIASVALEFAAALRLHRPDYTPPPSSWPAGTP